MLLHVSVFLVASVSSISLRQMSFSDDLDAMLPEKFSSDTELVEAVDDLDDSLTIFMDGQSYDLDYFYEGMETVDEVIEELDEGEYVILDGDEMDAESLSKAQAQATQGHEEKYSAMEITSKFENYTIDELEFALEQDLGGIIEELVNELDIWQDLLESIDTTEDVEILGEIYTYEDIENEIEELEDQIKLLEDKEEEGTEDYNSDNDVIESNINELSLQVANEENLGEKIEIIETE